VVGYGEVPTDKGLVLQDGSGYDGVSLAGFAASSSQLVFFSTVQETPAGFPALPVIKVASNSRTYEAMKDDMDVNAGSLVEGKSLDGLRAEMIDLMIRVINGEKTKAEVNWIEIFTFMTVHTPFEI
jgi:altronate dehydratase large subunit